MSEPVALADNAVADAQVQAPPSNLWSDEPPLEKAIFTGTRSTC